MVAPATQQSPEYAGNDFYCDVAIPRPEDLHVVFRDAHVLAFHHTRPYWPTHVVVVPTRPSRPSPPSLPTTNPT